MDNSSTEHPGTKSPRISVLMSVYNCEAYLAEAIESVLGQSFADFEFLVHDDGSTDGSFAILQAYATRDRRVRASRAENRGVPTVINELISRARGEFIARFDADDVCLPDRFTHQLARFEAAPDLIVLGTGYLEMDGAGRPIRRVILPKPHEEIDALNLCGCVALHQPTAMIRRSALLEVGGYDEDFWSAEDHDLWLRLAEVGRLENSPQILLHYRLHERSISATRSEEQRASCLRACEKAWARRGRRVEFRLQPWRMEDTPESRRAYYLGYAWQAWNNGFRDTWRHYAWQSIRLAPFSLKAWKVLVLGALRRPQVCDG